MFVDITEFRPDGRVSLRPGVDLAAAMPDREARNRVMSALVFARGPATLITEDGAARIVITRTRNRPPKGGAAFAIRVRPKIGPAGAAAQPMAEPMPWSAARTPNAPQAAPRLVDRIATVMRRQEAETGACTVRDLRQAGLSYRQITRHADAAREVIAAAELA